MLGKKRLSNTMMGRTYFHPEGERHIFATQDRIFDAINTGPSEFIHVIGTNTLEQ